VTATAEDGKSVHANIGFLFLTRSEDGILVDIIFFAKTLNTR